MISFYKKIVNTESLSNYENQQMSAGGGGAGAQYAPEGQAAGGSGADELTVGPDGQQSQRQQDKSNDFLRTD